MLRVTFGCHFFNHLCALYYPLNILTKNLCWLVLPLPIIRLVLFMHKYSVELYHVLNHFHINKNKKW